MPDWHHAPVHRFEGGGTFFITGATYLKQQFYRTASFLDALQKNLFGNAASHDCWLQAWSLLSNHYHLVLKADDGEKVGRMLARFHTESAIELNRVEGTKGRRVWYQFWDKTLTFEKSWLARLRYTHENAVHHRVIARATAYPWCSASWFERSAPRKFVETVNQFKIDRVNVYDDFGDLTKAVASPPHS